MLREKTVVLSLVLVLLFLASTFVGAFGGDDFKNEDEEVVLRIPHYKAGQNVGAKFFLPQVDRFNEKYQGEYEIIIEEVPQDLYADKIKLLQQQGKLPPLIEGPSQSFMDEVIIPNDLFYDLKPWIESHPKIKDILISDSLEYNTQNDKVVTLPLAVMRPIGLYYNKEMFKEAGINKEVAKMSFKEFEEALSKLDEAGHDPLSLMTAENAWTTMLLSTAILANQPGGEEILASQEPVYDYTGETWIKTFEKLRNYLRNYTTDNAIGAAYADAANNFLNERAAIIANGTWMVGDFYDESKAVANFDKKVGASIYPGGISIADVTSYSWWIPKGLNEEEKEGALAFLEFMYQPEELEKYMLAEGGVAPKLDTSDSFKEELDPILLDLNKSVSNYNKTTVQLLENIWPSQIGQGGVFGRYLPKLADGTLTPKKFADILTLEAERFKD